MKIMAVKPELGNAQADRIGVEIVPDSAILKDGKPFFVPDFAGKWEFSAGLAFRISRLGKNIAEKFASRYFDAVTLCMRVTPIDMTEQCPGSAIVTSFDNSVILGEWQPITELTGYELKINDEVLSETSTSDVAIEKAVSELSRYFTMKIGDIVIPFTRRLAMPVEIDTFVSGSLNGVNVLGFKIK